MYELEVIKKNSINYKGLTMWKIAEKYHLILLQRYYRSVKYD